LLQAESREHAQKVSSLGDKVAGLERDLQSSSRELEAAMETSKQVRGLSGLQVHSLINSFIVLLFHGSASLYVLKAKAAVVLK